AAGRAPGTVAVHHGPVDRQRNPRLQLLVVAHEEVHALPVVLRHEAASLLVPGHHVQPQLEAGVVSLAVIEETLGNVVQLVRLEPEHLLDPEHQVQLAERGGRVETRLLEFTQNVWGVEGLPVPVDKNVSLVQHLPQPTEVGFATTVQPFGVELGALLPFPPDCVTHDPGGLHDLIDTDDRLPQLPRPRENGRGFHVRESNLHRYVLCSAAMSLYSLTVSDIGRPFVRSLAARMTFSTGVTYSAWSGLTHKRTWHRWSWVRPSGGGPTSLRYAQRCAYSKFCSALRNTPYPESFFAAVHSQHEPDSSTFPQKRSHSRALPILGPQAHGHQFVAAPLDVRVVHVSGPFGWVHHHHVQWSGPESLYERVSRLISVLD